MLNGKQEPKTGQLKWLEGKKVAFIGDSVTADTRSNYVTITLDLLTKELNVTKLSVINSGIDSSSILDALDRLPDIMTEADPDVLVIFIGINDSKIFYHLDRPLIGVELFEESYSAFLTRADVGRSRKKLLINLPPLLFDEIRTGNYLKDFWYWTAESYEKYNLAIQRLAQHHSCVVADIFSSFRSHRGTRLFNEDGVHPNIYGHRLIADEVVKAFFNFES